jgi:hypothetical protein
MQASINQARYAHLNLTSIIIIIVRIHITKFIDLPLLFITITILIFSLCFLQNYGGSGIVNIFRINLARV